jgi:hypothetical protein
MEFTLKKALRYLFKATGIAIALLLVFWLVVLAYVTINKKQVIGKITRELTESMNAKVMIGDLDPSFFKTFPFVSLRLSNIAVRDSLWEVHHHDFLKAEKLFLRVNPFSLFSSQPKINKILVEKGSIYLFTDTSSYTNAYIMKAKKQQTRKGLRPPFDAIELKQVRLTFVNPFRAKLFDFEIAKLVCNVESEDSTTLLAVKTDMLVHDLGFNTDRGIFLHEKRVEGKFDVVLGLELIQFDDIIMRLDYQPFQLSGNFHLGEDPSFKLSISSRKAYYPQLTGLLTSRLQRKLDTFQLRDPINVDATIEGSLLPKTIPLINVTWEVKNNKLKTPVGEFDDCSLTGRFTNQADSTLKRDDDNSVIRINSFSGKWEKIPLSASAITISKLSEPLIEFDLHTSVELNSLNALTGLNSFDFNKGKAEVNVNFRGPIMEADTTQTTISGAVDILNGEVTYLPRNLLLKNLEGALIFDKKDVFIKELKARTKRSDMMIEGRVNNFLSMLNMVSDNMSIDLNIKSSKLDLNDFTQNLDRRKSVSSNNNSKARFVKMAGKIDRLIEESALKIDLDAKKISFKKFVASNVKAAVSVNKDQWTLHSVSLNHAGGLLSVNGLIKNDGINNPFSLKGKMDKIDISEVFYSFNNFSIDGLTDKNIQGELTADFDISASVNSKAEIVPYSTRGLVNISLKNGGLQNFEPMQKISNSIFKKRDMSDIRFAELKDHLTINGTSIKINSMEIQSTVLTMFIQGTYDMQSGTDLSILVPLSNLKKRGPDYELVNQGVDSKKGITVHLRAKTGEDGKLKVVWDPFKKALKKKDKKLTQN